MARPQKQGTTAQSTDDKIDALSISSGAQRAPYWDFSCCQGWRQGLVLSRSQHLHARRSKRSALRAATGCAARSTKPRSMGIDEVNLTDIYSFESLSFESLSFQLS